VSPPISGSPASDVSADIRRYCATHPSALDSVEGIAMWVAMQRHEDVLKQVREAVDQLVNDGVLVKYKRESGEFVFGCSARGNAPCQRTSD
jgi:hypothetical protein